MAGEQAVEFGDHRRTSGGFHWGLSAFDCALPCW